VTKYEGTCPGTSAIGALELATKGNWAGKYFGVGLGYFVEAIDARSLAEPDYWGFWLNDKFEEKGVCQVEVEPGDQLLFFPACFSETPGVCPSEPTVLGIDAPPTAEVGKPLTVTVNRYNAKGEPTPAAGIAVAGGGASAETDAEGHATLTFTDDDTYTLRAEGPPAEVSKAVPGEALVCVHTGDDGTCGTPAPPGPSIAPSSVTAPAPLYTGPYALVAHVTGVAEGHVYPRGEAPRVLSGTVSTHTSAVTSVSLRLRRTYRGRCWAYNGSSERLQRVRCHQGGFFQVASGGSSFSYLLPSRLPPGRYVLDIEATDAAGNRTPLDRGSSRIVFYVK
jgi:hypothetical protein